MCQLNPNYLNYRSALKHFTLKNFERQQLLPPSKVSPSPTHLYALFVDFFSYNLSEAFNLNEHIAEGGLKKGEDVMNKTLQF